MKELLVSPAHFQAAYGPNAEPRFATAAMTWGLAFHARVLEPEKFDNLFYDRSKKPKDKTISELKEMLDEEGIEYVKASKKADLEALLWPEGKQKDKRTSMDPKDFENVVKAAEALRIHDITGDWFSPGNKDYRKWNEVSAYVKNELGQTLKGRFDRLWIDDTTVRILDLKTTQSAQTKDFTRSVVNFSYDLQAAWYTHLAERCWPDKQVEFYFIAVGKKPPFGTSVFRATPSILLNGRKKMAKALELYAQCEALDYWPGYEPMIHDLDLPSWGQLKDDDAASEF